MSLIATARALDDARFLWRVSAAALGAAAQKVNLPNGPEQSFAEYVLDHPMQPNQTLAALVACNAAISAAIEVDQFNTVNTEAVTDADIVYVVNDVWTAAASRHAETSRTPTTGAPA